MEVAHVGGILMKHAMTSSQVKKARARIDAAHKETRGRLDGLGAAIATTNIQQQREHLNWLTTDPTALLSHNFYGSFEEDRLLNEFTLPEAVELPKAVVKHAVFSRRYEAEWKKGGLNKVPHSLLPNLNQEAHSGLSTGSGCSPIIAMITVSNLAWSTMADVDMVNFFDNFLVLASSGALLGKAISKLSAAIEQLPGGHFTPREVFRTHAADGFDFLGHCLYLDGNLVRISPTEGNFHDFCSECDRLDTKLGNYLFRPSCRDIPRGIGIAVDQLQYIVGFLSAFKECGPQELAFYEFQFWSVLDSLNRAGVSHETLARAVSEKASAMHPPHQIYA